MKKMMIMPQRMRWNRASGEVSGSSQLCLCVYILWEVFLLLGLRLFVFFVFFSFWMGLKIGIFK